VRRERRSQVSGETEYAFRHVLVRDVAYGQIPRGRRGDKHRAVAEWIGQLAPDRAEDHAEMLAHHYLSALEFARAAGQPTEALAAPARLALRDAGDRALALSAFPSARRFYEAALELWAEDDSERGQLLLRYGKARYYIDPSWEVFGEARDLLLATDEHEAAAEAEVLLGHVLRHGGESDRGWEHFDNALALVEDMRSSPAKALVLATVSRSLMVGGQNKEAIRVGGEALAIAAELGSLPDEALARLYAAEKLIAENRRAEGDAELQRALAFYRSSTRRRSWQEAKRCSQPRLDRP
jgi:predicted ATPase